MLTSHSKNIDLMGIKQDIEKELESYLSGCFKNHQSLKEPTIYAVLSGGKRIRPLLALALATDLGLEYKALVRPALALELFHASSLIHDDLPALDNDDYRRGQPSCHKAYGEAQAILSGDYLISLSFAAVTDSKLSSNHQVKAIKILAESFRAVCEGQAKDIAQKSISELDAIHILKTASLFKASALLGVLEIEDLAITKAASDFGTNFGLYFQSYNDLLDLGGTVTEKGRPSNSDENNSKKTYFTNKNVETGLRKLDYLSAEVEKNLEALARYNPKPLTLSLTREIFNDIKNRVSELMKSV